MAGYQVPQGWVVQAYRFALDPTPRQARMLASHAGAARKAFNVMLDMVGKNLDQRAAERSYGLSEDELTPVQGWSLPQLRKTWNRIKHEVAPWWAANSKEAYNTGLDALARGLDAWSKSRTGQRAGAKVGFPRFKAKHRADKAVRFTTGTIRVEPDRHHLTLPVIGTLHTLESTRKLARRVEAGTAKILSATVRFEGGRWYCAFQTIVAGKTRLTHAARSPYPVVGVDAGVKDLMVVAAPDGTEVDRVPAPKPLAAARAKLVRQQRRAARRRGPWDPVTKRRQDASKRWARAQAQVGRTHARVANLRRHALHEATTTLAQQHSVVVIEDLNVAGMARRGGARKRGLNRSLADASLARLRAMLDYKSRWYGTTMVVADRWFASTQLCSGCGAKTKLPLHERLYRCGDCGLVIDRDLNAAINLARLGDTTHAGGGTGTGTGSGPAANVSVGQGRGADRKTRPTTTVVGKAGGVEASTPHGHTAGKTGTAAPQGTAA
ncbi:IS607 family element RNA-guided endonuclease TnpB [Nocardia sp. NPDC052112]|uniref:IS607 family element RNA-guided endonuclease TnpB n=1 Tax=Nocardia sp. NPDC052112 TaxID=3155646 RepID=UPI003433F7F1